MKAGRFSPFLPVFSVLLAFLPAGAAPPEKTSQLFPPLLVCQSHPGGVTRVQGAKITWEYRSDGPVLNAQPQVGSRVLVTGGASRVLFLRPTSRGYRKVWDWKSLKGLKVSDAVVADWGPKNEPSLILGADRSRNRIFLADAKSRRIKIRWEYPLPSPPLAVSLCPDSGNFLVTLEDSTVREIYFKQNQEVWSAGPREGLVRAADAIRDASGSTFVADALGGKIIRLNPGKRVLWKAVLPLAPKGSSCDGLTLSLYQKKGSKERVLATLRVGDKNVIYALDAQTGRLLGRMDVPLKPGAVLLRAVPDFPQRPYWKRS